MPVVELKTLASTVEGLIQAASQLSADAPSGDYLAGIIERGEFRPLENEAIGYWFARYLTIRESLWSVIDDGRQAMDDPSLTDKDDRLRYFLVGYAAACVLVGIDRVMLFDVAKHTIVQRKLNEPFQELRIPRKQYTRVFEAFQAQYVQRQFIVLDLLEELRELAAGRFAQSRMPQHVDTGRLEDGQYVRRLRAQHGHAAAAAATGLQPQEIAASVTVSRLHLETPGAGAV